MPKETFVKIIPKPKPKTPVLVKVLFWLSLILLMSCVAAFFFLQNKNTSLKEEKLVLQKQITEEDSGEQKTLENEILGISQKIKDFSELFQEHRITSKLFDLLKSSCHKRVRFTSLNLQSQSQQITLAGETDNFQTLGEQFLIFRQNENTRDLKVLNISLDKEGKVNFNITFFLPSEFFQQ